MKSIYIAGQVSGLPYKEANKNFEKAEKILTRSGFHPVNPLKEVPQNDEFAWADYMEKDIALLLRCDGIFMLSNWGNSRGARVEYSIAKELGITIYYEENFFTTENGQI